MKLTKQDVIKYLVVEQWANEILNGSFNEYTKIIEKMAKKNGIDINECAEEIRKGTYD